MTAGKVFFSPFEWSNTLMHACMIVRLLINCVMFEPRQPDIRWGGQEFASGICISNKSFSRWARPQSRNNTNAILGVHARSESPKSTKGHLSSSTRIFCFESEEVGGLGSYCDFGALVPFPRLGKLAGRSPVVIVDLVVADLQSFFAPCDMHS